MGLVVFAIVLLAAGVFAVPALVYMVLLPRMTMRRAEAPLPYATCSNCGKAVRGCHHFHGVPSQWVHVITGSAYCENGTDIARHA
jgi:hypothetical protein